MNHAASPHELWTTAEWQATILQVEWWCSFILLFISSMSDSCYVPTVCRCQYDRLLPHVSRDAVSIPRFLYRMPSQRKLGEACCARSDLGSVSQCHIPEQFCCSVWSVLSCHSSTARETARETLSKARLARHQSAQPRAAARVAP